MNPNNNPFLSQLNERENVFQAFREIYARLDNLMVALSRPSLYTLREYEELARDYRILQPRADRMEEYIRLNFPLIDLDEQISRMKSGLDDEDLA